MSPVAYWRLGERSGTVARDEMGLNHGAYVAAPTLGVSGALVGDPDTAVKFDGLTQQVTIPDSDAFSVGATGSLTVALSVKPSATAAASKDMIGKNSPTGYEWNLFRYDRAAYLNIFSWFGGGLGQIEVLSALTNGLWTPIVAVFRQSGTCTLYIDGVARGSVTMSGDTIASSAPVTIGQRGDGNEFSDDTIDEVAIFGRALTPAEIRTMYEVGMGH